MEGKLIISPFCKEEDYFYTEVLRGIYPYEYEITIKIPLMGTFEEMISKPYDFDEILDISICVVSNSPEDVKFFKEIKNNRLEYLKNVNDIIFNHKPKEVAEFVRKNPVLKTKRIIFEDYFGLDLEFVNEIGEAFGNDISNVYFQIFGNEKLICFEEYKATVEAINKKIREIERYEFSPLEKIMYVYDMVRDKIYTEVNDGEDKMISRNLTSALLGDKIVCVGYSKIFTILLKKLGVKCENIVLKQPNKNVGHMRNVIYVKDEKYGVDGVYYFDPTWDSKKNESGNDFLYSYRYFARTKKTMNSIDGGKLIDVAFPYYSDNLVMEFSEQVDKVGFERLPKEMIKSINTMFRLITDDVLINMAYFDPIAPTALRPNKDEVAKKLEKLVEYFDKPLSADILLKVLYNVRKQQYYTEPEKYPLGLNEFSKIVYLSGWYYNGTPQENLDLIFARTPKAREKIKAKQTVRYTEETNMHKQIQGVKLSKILRRVYEQKNNN